jgi:uncharacterized membrane protein YidH (DUF202 family)
MPIFAKITTAGNPARDHLSNERTVLAYIRTSLNMMLYGLLLVQLARYVVLKTFPETLSKLPPGAIYDTLQNVLLQVNKFYKPLGILVFSMALFTLAVGAFRYTRMFSLLFASSEGEVEDEFEGGLPVAAGVFVGVVAIAAVTLSSMALL